MASTNSFVKSSKNKTMNFINKYAKDKGDNYLMSTLERSSSFHLKSKTLFSKFRKTVSVFNKESASNMKNFYKIKQENSHFRFFYSNAKKGPSMFFPKNEMKQFNSLIDQYKKKQYNVPNISLNHNIFKFSPLFELDNDSIMRGPMYAMKDSQKGEIYLRKLKHLVYHILTDDKDENIKNNNVDNCISRKVLSEERHNLCKDIKVLVDLITKNINLNDESSFPSIQSNKATIKKLNSNSLNQSAKGAKSYRNKTRNWIPMKRSMSENKNSMKQRSYRSKNSTCASNQSCIKKNIEETLNQTRNDLATLESNKEINRTSFAFGEASKGCTKLVQEHKNPSTNNVTNENFFEYAYKNFYLNNYNEVIDLLVDYLQKNQNYNDNDINELLNQEKNEPKDLLNNIKKINEYSSKKKFHESVNKVYLNSNKSREAAPLISKIKKVDNEIKNLEKSLLWRLAPSSD